MKKHLLSTSAIALGVAMAAPASAQDWNLKWGGFANSHVGIVDVSGTGVAAGADFDGVNIFVNSEIIFSPSVTLDNGMTFGFSVQWEALNQTTVNASTTSGGQRVGGTSDIDESYVTISSDTLGRVIIGSENSAGYLLMGSVYTPGVSSMPINSRSTSAFIPVTGSGGFRQAALSSLTEVAGNNDVPRLTYFTPSFNGLTLGVSYAPSAAPNARNAGPVNFNAGVVDIFDLGVGYKQSFNGVDIGLAARWGTADNNLVGVSDPTTWAIGGTVGVAGFSIGATYAENDNGAATGVGDQEGWSLGATYDIAGPWTVGLSTYQGETSNGGGAPTSDYEAYLLGASRSLGSGVSWDIYYVYQETNNGAVGGNPSIDGNLLATAINLSF